MTDTSAAVALSALLLLGATAAHAAGPQVAELVPVDPPVMYYPLPSNQAPAAPAPAAPAVPAAPAAQSTPAGQAPAPGTAPTKSGPSVLEDGWEGGPAKDKDGKFAYCAIEGRFDTGHTLMVARNPKGEVNLGIGIPGAELPGGQQWKVKVSVDGKLTRERIAVAPKPDMLVVPNGKDDELYSAMMSGKELVFSSDSDRIVFQLKGTKKILGDLKTCVDKSGDVPPMSTASNTGKDGKPKGPALPAGLSDLLRAAGVRDAQAVALDNIPKDERPADLAWRIGPIMGGIKERVVGDDAKLADLTEAYVEAMKKRCDGTHAATLNPAEEFPGLSLRTGAMDCTLKEGNLHVSLTFFLSSAHLFTVLFHESADADKALADKVRDNLAEVLRKIATAPAPAAQAGAPAAPQAAAPEKAKP
ncbi:hypothetical protein [Azospirillum canadense]|uniref:hypothetical protein n=1 Tax=Azospirillum canadense TaxID=403962 RepID=UPI0022263F5B|nr:hypothetical protein [Azospirillum canadense]MCW2237395.1 hypothetical protein [Azospirillum canadense]